MTRLLPLLLCLLAATAWADDDEPPTVAIVPLDGAPGTSSRDLDVVARGLAEAMARSGELVVVSGSSLVDRLTELKQQALQEARDATSEGALLLAEGDPDIGIAFLEAAVDAHERAASAVVRRDEMADAAFALARAWLETGREEQAASVLALALRLVPDYLDVQPEEVGPALRALARRVEDDLATQPPRRLSAGGARSLQADLQVDQVVHGFVLSDGSLTLLLYDAEGSSSASSRLEGPFAAPRLGDPRYDELAIPLVDAALGRQSAAPVAPPAPRRSGRAAATAGIAVGLLAIGGATAAVLATRPSRAPVDGWALQVRIVR